MLQIKDQKLFERIQAMPKAEVHLHLDGSIPAEDIFEMARKKGKKLRKADCGLDGNKITYADPKEQDILSSEALAEYWMGWDKYSIPDRFGIVTGMMQTREDIHAICKYHVQSLKRQKILYAETRFAPQYHLREGLSLDQVIGYVLEGLEEACQKTKVIVKLIVCIGREISSDESVNIAKAALKFQNDGVVALDLACWETPYPPEIHKKAFELTFDSNLKRTVHAGEMCPDEEQNLRNIYTALEMLRADGLGHAIPLHKRYYKKHDLIEMMVERGVRLESNPVSNLVVTSLKKVEDLHLDFLMQQGVAVTINSDDPAFWPSGTLSHNLYVMAELYGEMFIKQAIHNAFTKGFGLKSEEKMGLFDISFY